MTTFVFLFGFGVFAVDLSSFLFESPESDLVFLLPSVLVVESFSLDLSVVDLVESFSLEFVSAVVVVDELSVVFEFAVFEEFTVVLLAVFVLSVEEPPNGQPAVKKLEKIINANAFFINIKLLSVSW
jgi:hypothetical protein